MTRARKKKTGKRRSPKKEPPPAAAPADAAASSPAPEPVSDPPPAPSWLIVDRMQLTELLGISDNTISDWLKAGMPAIERGGRGKPGSYDAIACLKWYRENKVGRNALEIARTESAREDVILKRFKAGELARELVRVQEVRAMGQRFVKAWTALVRGLPKQARRAGVVETAEKEQQLAALCRRTLEEISRWSVPEEFKVVQDADDTAA